MSSSPLCENWTHECATVSFDMVVLRPCITCNALNIHSRFAFASTILLALFHSAAECASSDGKRKAQVLWPIFQLSHQRTRYVFEALRRGAISREVWEYCVAEGHADGALAAKWKKAGYERLCCLRCVSTRDTNFGTACKCRVPRAQLGAAETVECQACGCRGCASGDGKATLIDVRAGSVVGSARPISGHGAGAAADNGSSRVSARAAGTAARALPVPAPLAPAPLPSVVGVSPTAMASLLSGSGASGPGSGSGVSDRGGGGGGASAGPADASLASALAAFPPMPAGWKPGDALPALDPRLLLAIPPMPPGWVPGAPLPPVSLPPVSLAPAALPPGLPPQPPMLVANASVSLE